MNTTGLKFMMDHGVWMMVLVTEAEANEIIKNWMSGFYRLKDIRIIGSTTPPPSGWAWAVEVDNIRGIHTFDPSVVLGQTTATRRTETAPQSYISGLAVGPLNTPMTFKP